MAMSMHGHRRFTALHSLFLKYLRREHGIQKCEAVPHRCGPLQVGDILRLAAPRRPRRLNVHVSRTLKAAASGK